MCVHEMKPGDVVKGGANPSRTWTNACWLICLPKRACNHPLWRVRKRGMVGSSPKSALIPAPSPLADLRGFVRVEERLPTIGWYRQGG